MDIPPMEVAMTEVVLQEMETYVSLRQNTVSQFITIGPIMYLCLAVEKRPRPKISKRWWGKYVVDVEGMWVAD